MEEKLYDIHDASCFKKEKFSSQEEDERKREEVDGMLHKKV